MGLINRDIPSLPKMSKEEISAELMRLFKQSELTHKELAELLGAKVCTIDTWCEGRRTPPQYVLEYVKFKIDNLTRTPTNNAEAIREMDDKDLATFLAEIRDDALEANGVFDNLSDEFKDIDAFLQSDEFVKRQVR